jgi:hypothetical protein
MYLHEEVQSIGKHARASKALMMECWGTKQEQSNGLWNPVNTCKQL